MSANWNGGPTLANAPAPREAPPLTAAKSLDIPGITDREQRFTTKASTATSVARPRRAPALRVGFITPNLIVGGVEYWLLGLLRHCGPRLAWSIGVTNPDVIDSTMRAKVEEFSPVGCGASGVQSVVANSDIIVTWGVGNLRQVIGNFPGQVVVVAHGCGAWTDHWLASARPAVDHFVAVSSLAAASCRAADVTIIPNGVDGDRCHAVRSRAEMRGRWELRAEEIAIGYVGRLSSEKNAPAVSEAVRALGAGYRAVYVGYGWGSDRVRDEAMRITPDAIFVPPMHQVGDALGALDCLIAASPSEGFGLAPVEAMYCGLPVVATPVGILPEIENQYGPVCVTVPIHPTPEQLANAVRSALSPDNRPIVELAARVVRAHCTAEACAARWTDFLLHLS